MTDNAIQEAKPLETRLVAFARALRSHGITCGTSEIADASLAIQALGLDDREQVREGLAATLMRRSSQRRVFDDLFDLFFPAVVGDSTGTGPAAEVASDAASRRAHAADLREELADALARRDERALTELARRTVAELGRLDGESGRYSSAQANDTLAPQTAIAAALRRARDAGNEPGGSGQGSSGEGSGSGGAGGMGGSGGGGGGGGQGAGALDLTRDELRSQVAAFRRAVETEARRRNAELTTSERSRYAVAGSVELTSFQLADDDASAQIRRAIEPLAHKLATRMAARRRRASRGRIDLRRTVRRSLGTGGIPMRPAHEHPARVRTELVLLTDMSSSVARFSVFTIMLVQALRTQFRRVRVFGFVNVCEELTERFEQAPPGADLSREFTDTSRMTRWHSASDYGTALQDFAEHHLDAVGPRTVVLVLGDARTNFTDPQVDSLRRVVERARRVVWLNPEPASSWGTGDSVAPAYAEVVDMHEVRNLAQLRQFVSRSMPV